MGGKGVVIDKWHPREVRREDTPVVTIYVVTHGIYQQVNSLPTFA